MADGETIDVTNDKGVQGTIPAEQWEDAVDAGYKLRSHIVMYDKSGTRGIVPKEQAGQARDAGYSIMKPGGETQFEKERAHAGDWAYNLGQKAWEKLKSFNPVPEGLGAPITSREFWFGKAAPGEMKYSPFHIHPTQGGLAEAGREAAAGYKEEVRHPSYFSRAAPMGAGAVARGAAAGLGSALGGVSERKMEQLAETGDTSGIVAEAGVPAAVQLGTYGLGRGIGKIAEGVNPRRVQAFDNAVRTMAGRTPADLEFSNTLQQARGDIAEIARERGFGKNVVQRTIQGGGFEEEGNARVGEFAEMLHEGADRIWRGEHEPQIAAQANDPVRTANIRAAADAAITPQLEANNPEAAAEARKWIASALDDKAIGTVAKADKMLRVINAEIPNLPEPFKNIGKIVRRAAQDSIRGELHASLTGAGQPGVHIPNTRWGALTEIANTIEKRLNVQPNVPLDVWRTIKNSMRAGYHVGAPAAIAGYTFGGPVAGPVAGAVGEALGAGTELARTLRNQPGTRIARTMRGLARTGEMPETVTTQPAGPPAFPRPAPPAPLGGGIPGPAGGGPAGPPPGRVAPPPGPPAAAPPAGAPPAPPPVNVPLPAAPPAPPPTFGPTPGARAVTPPPFVPQAPPAARIPLGGLRGPIPGPLGAELGPPPGGVPGLAGPLEETPAVKAQEAPALRQEVQEMGRARERSPHEIESNRRELIKRYRDILAHPEATPEERTEAEARLKELGFNVEATRAKAPAATSKTAPQEAKTPEEAEEEAHVEGVRDTEKAPAQVKAQPVEKEFSRDQVEEGELLIRQELDMMSSADRPGRYYSENPMGEYNPQGEQSAEAGITAGGHWYGVKSLRNSLPWMRENHWAPAQLEKALRNKDSAMYQRAVRNAIEFLEREKENTAAEEAEERAAIQGEEPEEAPPGETPPGVLPGFGEAVRQQERGAAQVRAEGLEQELGTPRSIEEAAGRMERESPLFRYTEANPQEEMFPPVGRKRRVRP